jgi:Domain of unknown function (DUF4037)
MARCYWSEVVAPLLERQWPVLPYTAARLGGGSDVLGLDDAMSRDHDWGLRLTLLVAADRVVGVRNLLERELPATFHGFPTRFATSWDPAVVHRVDVLTPESFAARHLGVGLDGPADAVDWLALTGQSVLEVTAGPVFADSDGRISRLREILAWYPRDLWRYTVACDWQRIDQELPFIGRTAQLGDDLGSRLVTARLVRVAMHLGFLLQQRWAPYPKWFGIMFATLPIAARVQTPLGTAMVADTGEDRENALCLALESLLEAQRKAGLPAPSSVTRPFFDRPFRSLSPDVVAMLRHDIKDPVVRALPLGVGAIEQWVDNVDVLVQPCRRAAVTSVWRSLLQADTDPL